ncbi:hypothetical protein [Yinghuangia seranimata]|uniref:hypothetical protein n=1 Tax=Yinghuangia seranimata TaxID=408067 RepID=UPI00248CB1DA|nr:hypothetical protein [Yinghuangia seranimata]MDI2125061.1 hypothetical protein [Yinghuangia seranimata]
MIPALNAWTLDALPRLNNAVLAGDSPCESLTDALSDGVLPRLPADVGALPAADARRLTVLLGMWGSACVRHFVQSGRVTQTGTGAVFARLDVHGRGFRDYLGEVAARTGAGHPDRDTYVSYFHWNPPTVRVDYVGQHWCAPGVFEDGLLRTHTGDDRERELLLFVKSAEAVELAANDLIEPLLTEDLPPADRIERMTAAAVLLGAVHRIFAAFTRLPAERRMTPEFFTDTWRQYTNHWEPGDYPPSGAADAEFIARDLILGVDVPDYLSYVRRLFPALLPDGRARLTRLMGATPLPALVLARTGVTPDDLHGAAPDKLLAIAEQHPELAACYLLLAENVRVATAHLNFARRFVFDLRRTRDADGTPDTVVMSSRIGSTGIRESFMDELKNGRRRHPLTAFERVPRARLATLVGAGRPAGPDPVVSVGA